MKSHTRLLSILHIVYGGMHILAYIVINLLVGIIMPFIMAKINESNDEAAIIVGAVFAFLKILFLILIILIPVPSIVGGVAQLYQKAWGMTLMMISGSLSLLNIPIGTALGGYTIWVYMEKNKTITQANDKADE